MNNYDGLLYQEPTGDGHVHYKFTGLLPYACHKFLCAYAGLSLRATEGPWIIPCYYKHDPSYSHWKQKENRTNSISLGSKKKKKAEKLERIEPCWPEADRCCSATAFSATN